MSQAVGEVAVTHVRKAWQLGLLLLVALATVVLLEAPEPAYASEPPVAAYSFDEGEGETIEDLSGNEHTLAIEEGEWTDKGRYGGAIDFDEVESCLSTPSTTDLQLTEEFTLEAWVKPELNVSGDPVIVKEAEEGSSFALGLGFQEEGAAEAFIGEGAEETSVASEEEVPRNVWTHLAVTYDGAKLRLYVNGDLAGTQEVEDPPTAGSGPLRVGCDEDNGEFAGRIDEARVYNRALDAGEVVADRTAPLQTPQAGPIAAYSFDAGEGGVAEDLSGNGHEGTIEGADWTEKGRYGPGLDFDGEEDCLSTPGTPDLALTEEFTLEAWVRPDLPISGDPVIVKEAEEGDSFALGLGFEENGTPEAFIGEGAEQTEVASSEVVPRFVWTHLAATYDGARLRIYVNGELAATEAVDDPPAAGTGPLRVGCSEQDGEFGGRIDDEFHRPDGIITDGGCEPYGVTVQRGAGGVREIGGGGFFDHLLVAALQ